MQRCHYESIILLTYIYLGLLFHGSAGMHRLNVLPECSLSSAYCLKYPGEIDRKNTLCRMTEGILLVFNFESNTLTNVCLMGRPALAFAHCTNKMNFFSDFIFTRNAIVCCGISFDCRECSIVVNHSLLPHFKCSFTQ